MAEPLIKNVSDTAFLVAGFRAQETNRSDSLFKDPLAERLAGAFGMQLARGAHRSMLGGWVVIIRTVIIDNFIKECIRDGIDTVLNLGAGLDSRPYRMSLPQDLLWVEVDMPHMIEAKNKLLEGERPVCKLERIQLDLSQVDERQKILKAIANRSKKILVLTEGLVPYLSNDETAELAKELNSLSQVNYWVVDYLSKEAMRNRQRSWAARRMKNAPLKFDPEDWFGFFKNFGWKPKEIRYIPEEGDHLGRPTPWPRSIRFWIRLMSLLTPKSSRAKTKKFAAYVLLEKNESE